MRPHYSGQKSKAVMYCNICVQVGLFQPRKCAVVVARIGKQHLGTFVAVCLCVEQLLRQVQPQQLVQTKVGNIFGQAVNYRYASMVCL